jgi:hypothetical protein
MGTGFRGAFMVAWAQTTIEGSPAETELELAEGMSWSWHGRPLPLEGDGAALVLTASRDHGELRARAARVVQTLLRRQASGPADLAAADVPDDPIPHSTTPTRFFLARSWFPTALSSTPSFPSRWRTARRRCCCSPTACPRRIASTRSSPVPIARRCARPNDRPSVICFTPGTRLRTERGEVAIEDLDVGDRLLTRDDGAQDVIWSGHRRMSGARLFALPDQRPIRLRVNALGIDRPDEDLVVSPEHRVLVGGDTTRDLWGEAEVLVRAGDLVGDRGITVDHSLRETWYIHLMLERHQVVWANGVQVESFHPGFMGLDTLSGLQRESLYDLRPDLAGRSLRLWRARAADAEPGRGGDPVRRRRIGSGLRLIGAAAAH